MDDNSSDLQKVVEGLKAIKDNGVRDGIWEFVLLLSSQKMRERNITRDRTRDIWLLAFNQHELSARAPCFAARWATEEYIHKQIASTLRKDSASIVAKGDLFALMFFAMETPTLSPGERFKLLQPHYGVINKNGFSAYFLYGAKRIFFKLKKEESAYLENCMSMLAFSHLTGCEKELAKYAWETFIKIHGKDVEHNLITLMGGYLSHEINNARNEYDSRETNEYGCKPRYFRQFLLEAALNWSWRQRDKYSTNTFFSLLFKIGWYNGIPKDIDLHIFKEMRTRPIYHLVVILDG